MQDKLKEFIVDENIDTDQVQVKTDKGLSEPRDLFEVIRSVDRSTSHVVQLTGTGEREVAVVQIMERRDMVKKVQRKEELSRKSAHALKIKKPKQLELNWAIAPNDLQIKLKQMEGFLQKGKKVELLLAAKRRQRKATAEEAEELLQAIRDRMSAVGAKEAKPLDGKVLGQAVMVLENKTS